MHDLKWYPALLLPLAGSAGCEDNGTTTADRASGASAGTAGASDDIDAGAPGIGGGGQIVVYYGPPETGGAVGSGGQGAGALGGTGALYGPLPTGGAVGSGGQGAGAFGGTWYGPPPTGGAGA